MDTWILQISLVSCRLCIPLCNSQWCSLLEFLRVGASQEADVHSTSSNDALSFTIDDNPSQPHSAAHPRNERASLRMPTELQRLFLARHGDTPWTVSGQHTGRTDVALNDQGEQLRGNLASDCTKTHSFEFLPARCSELRRRVNWLDMDQQLRSILTCSNGITANSKERRPAKFLSSILVGSFTATAVPMVNLRMTSCWRAPTDSLLAFARFRVTFWLFPAATLFA